jgi:cytochrome P450
VAWLEATNADPARLPDPDQLNLSRNPNAHVTFGSGIRFCLGAPLARVEAQVGFERLFSRYPRLALAVADSELKPGFPRWLDRFGMAFAPFPWKTQRF